MAAEANTVQAKELTPPKPPDIPQKTFASIVAGQKKEAYIEAKNPSTHKGEPAVFFTENEVKILSEPFKYSLVGKFPRGRPNMISIRNFFIKLNLKAEYKIGLLDSKHILIHLHNEDDYHRIWIRNQWNIFQYPMTISKWHVNFTPDNESPILPIWVSMPYLPPHLFREDALLSIARTIGTPMRTDTSTATLARPSKARVCVEVDVSKTLPRRSYIGQGDQGFWQYFQYEDIPLYCNDCRKIGHDSKHCIMKNDTNAKTEKIDKQQADITERINNKAAQNKAPINEQKNQRQIYIQKPKEDINKQGHVKTANVQQHSNEPIIDVEQQNPEKVIEQQPVNEESNQNNQRSTPIQQVTILSRGVTLNNSFSVLDTDNKESEGETVIDTQEEEHRTNIVLPKSIEHLQLEMGDRTMEIESNGLKECCENLNASDEDRSKESEESSDDEDMPDDIGTEITNQVAEDKEENKTDGNKEEEFQKITVRRKKEKVIASQRTLRSNAKGGKAPADKTSKAQDGNRHNDNNEIDILEH